MRQAMAAMVVLHQSLALPLLMQVAVAVVLITMAKQEVLAVLAVAVMAHRVLQVRQVVMEQ